MRLKFIYALLSVIILSSKIFESNQTDERDLKTRSKRSIFIMPGTYWCGAGNSAPTCDHLGEYRETDKCCREHDACPYTFSFNQPSYNGYYSDKIYSLSHCECDSIFYDCLHEMPYKDNSFLIWESFNSIGVKCFAYLPCSSNYTFMSPMDPYIEFWRNLGHRHTGFCSNGSRVVLFDSIFDYYNYMDAYLTIDQLFEVKSQLHTKYEQFTSPRKRNFKCNYMFSNLTQKLANNFGKYFIKPSWLPSSTLMTSTIRTNQSKIENNLKNDSTPTKTTTSLYDGIKSSTNKSKIEMLKPADFASSQSSSIRAKRALPDPSKLSRHTSLSKLEYPIIITCFVLSFMVFTGLFLALLV